MCGFAFTKPTKAPCRVLRHGELHIHGGIGALHLKGIRVLIPPLAFFAKAHFFALAALDSLKRECGLSVV